MNIALLSGYSDKLADLVAITHPNHEQYAKRHRYTWITSNQPYTKEGHSGFFERILNLLSCHDAVLVHDADVLFMNHRITVESLICPDSDGVVMARETHGWWPINNGVTLFVAGTKARYFCDRMIKDFETWSAYQWLWQTHCWNLMQNEQRIADCVRLVHPKVMNATVFQSESAWQLGDFIVHFLGMEIADKIKFAKDYIKMAGEPILLQ